jgi:hypothetical protein
MRRLRARAAWVVFGTLAGVSLAACKEGPPEPEPAAPGEPSAKGSASKKSVESFGEPIGAGAGTPIADVLSAKERYQKKTVLVSGMVKKACSRKGCWMELSETLGKDAPGCRVTFKDYAFFVPLDSAGASARVRGEVELKSVSAKHVEHLESEGASFAHKNPDGSAT